MNKEYAIYVLDDYAVHLMPEIREAFLKKGYILVLIGGGITGDIQINDTHFHGPLKARYREKEMKKMLEKLESNPDKIPSPTRDEMMNMIVSAMSEVKIDTKKAFKNLFVTNALDLEGSEDHLVSDRLFQLVGREMQKFRLELLSEEAPKRLKDLLKSITPPKGIKRKNMEGTELFDCEGKEIEESIEEEAIENDEGEWKFFGISISL